jgi:hypothetical protein
MYIIMHITTGSRKGAFCLQQMHEVLHSCKTLITSRAKRQRILKQEEVNKILKYDNMILTPRKKSQYTGH